MIGRGIDPTVALGRDRKTSPTEREVRKIIDSKVPWLVGAFLVPGRVKIPNEHLFEGSV